MIADQRALWPFAGKAGRPFAARHLSPALRRRWEASRSRVLARDAGVPELGFPSELPITARRDAIIDAVRRHPVVVITGETGSGKTTQIPKMCLAAGLGRRGIIGLTQPRRIAAVSIAERIAQELGESCSRSVAYKIRFDEKSSADPLIKVMTDGILLAETVSDRDLLAYDTIIVDEAHERSLNIDFLLGYLRTLLARRKDLKVIVTSATIDTAKFAEAFGGAPVIEVSGRMYPVEVRYRPIDPVREEKGETTYVDEAVATVEKLQQEGRREDILIFLPTEQDIREVCARLAKRCSGLILPLYARLSAGAQKLVFAPADRQKIIAATNIAETSLTIPGIKYVIDTGLARMLEYNPRSQTTGLPVKPISRSSADQRKGRCGRVADGICIRLYARENFVDRPLYTMPEILRANLAGVILRMLALNLGSVMDFPFIDRPHPKAIRDGLETLRDLGAISRDECAPDGEVTRLTAVGRAMAQYPLDPRVSRMILEAEKEGCVNEIAVVAAALSIQDPRERPYDQIDRAAAAHAQFQHPESDFLTYLQIWNRYADTLEKMQSQGKLRKFCREHFLSWRRMMEWRDIYHQILDISGGRRPSAARRKPVRFDIDQAVSDKIARAILAGYLSNIAQKKEKNFYTAAKGREVMLHPGSGLFNRGGPWIVASEISRTSRLFARNAANIRSEWLEELGREHCRYTYSTAHWEKIRGQVVALEKVTLFGLTLVDGRKVAYDRISPEEARQIFIREALVPGEVGRKPPFLSHNLSLWEKVRTMEEKLRRRGIAADEETIARLYDERLPAVADLRSLERLIRDRNSDDFLRFREEDFIAADPDRDALAQYPDRISLGNAVLSCRYRFEPGQTADGVTVSVPLGLVDRTASENVERHLPSLLEEKALHLLKTLPKTVRQKLPPVAQIAAAIAKTAQDSPEHLPLVLSRFLSSEYGLTLPADSWAFDKLPPHLNIRYRVIDEKGAEVKTSRNLGELQKELVGTMQQSAMEACRSQWEKENLTVWTFGPLPGQIELSGKHGAAGLAYPALCDCDGGVSLRLFSSRREAEENHPKGVAALYGIHFADRLKQLKKNIALTGKRKEQAAAIGPPRALEQSVQNRIKRDLFEKPWRDSEAFLHHAAAVQAEILPYGQQMLAAVTPVIESFADTFTVLQKLLRKNRSNAPVVRFLKSTSAELHELVPAQFPERCAFDRLGHLPRYLKGLAIRAERGSLNLAATEIKLKDAASYIGRYRDILQRLPADASAEKRSKTEELFWMIEEYKISLFAQELKTPYPVSPKRLDQLIRDIEKIVY
ncbi:MAG: ATP-dependent RNA helicase HrpA [Syntrophaceae bacterium]|nr:ATP-dependent RNA helicase HrpA [Syntrophaceae bacterium]